MAEAHDTASKKVLVAPKGTGVSWMTHLVPFQRSTKFPSPTAVQAVAEVQDTPLKSLWSTPRGRGTCWIVQVVPSQRSARVRNPARPESKVPTAMHAEAELQATPARELSNAPAGSGLGWIVQAVPSHSSARVWRSESPTAIHAEAEMQDTPFMEVSAVPAGVAVGSTVQAVPSHPSARVWDELILERPTAVQAVAEVHDMP